MENNIGACGWCHKWRDEAYVALRVVTGILFFMHGYAKVFTTGVENVTTFFTNVGIPLAGVVAPIVAYGELLGGLALIVGLCVHWVAKLNIIIILGAIYFVHFANGYSGSGGYEYPLLILAVNIVIVTMGAGKYSLDTYCIKKKQVQM